MRCALTTISGSDLVTEQARLDGLPSETGGEMAMMMLRTLHRAVLAMAFTLALTSMASAHEQPTCSELGIETHAQHVIGDYVTGLGGIGGGMDWPPAGLIGDALRGFGALVPGGPGPGFHFTIEGLAPGASFCIPEAHPNGFNTPSTPRSPGRR
jgi:hypothetical protein